VKVAPATHLLLPPLDEELLELDELLDEELDDEELELELLELLEL
jgi:hypothetical protein